MSKGNCMHARSQRVLRLPNDVVLQALAFLPQRSRALQRCHSVRGLAKVALLSP